MWLCQRPCRVTDLEQLQHEGEGCIYNLQQGPFVILSPELILACQDAQRDQPSVQGLRVLHRRIHAQVRSVHLLIAGRHRGPMQHMEQGQRKYQADLLGVGDAATACAKPRATVQARESIQYFCVSGTHWQHC